MRLRGYLVENCYGLRDYRLEVDGDDLRGLGAIEGNVDKLIADRMRKRGMSWTKRGADKMARLISLRERGNLNTWVKYQSKPLHIPSRRKTMLKGAQYQDRGNSAWLSASLPALRGSHYDRPWGRVLWALAHGDMEI